MTNNEKEYYQDLLVRMKIAGADTFVFLSSDKVVLDVRPASEVFFNESKPNMAKVCTDRAEMFIFTSTHDDTLEINQKIYREMYYKSLETCMKLKCHPKLWLIDSEKHAKAIQRIEKEWGDYWEFLPLLIRSEAEYEQLMVKFEHTKEIEEELEKKQEELEKKQKEQRIITLQQFSDQCLEVLGKPIDIDNFLVR
ncbi:MAG: hypothetical protein RO257_14550 [Candidatus Kapabacteria bacterium]|nr:hypothetical protein [Candidatus Kapabacteria bacterium]